jgi:predicted HTH transcriptional regulator
MTCRGIHPGVIVATKYTEEKQRSLLYVREMGSIKRAEARKLLGTNDAKAGYVLRKMMKTGLLRKEGSFKDSLYLLP